MQSRLGDLGVVVGADDDKEEKGDGIKAENVNIEGMDQMGKSEMDETLVPYDGVLKGIQKIEKNIETIYALKQRSKTEVKDDAQKKIMEDLERVMVSSKRDARFVKGELDRLSAENTTFISANPGSTSAQIRKNLLNTHARHFQEVVGEYQTAGDSFKESLKERIARQARIVKEDITEEQIEELVANPNPSAIFQSAVIQMDDRMIDAVHDIEDRHKGMLAIEQGVKEIQELFNDMACLVDLQQETLDVIERNVQDTAKYTLDAEKNMTKAEQHAKNSRKKQCWMLLIVSLIVIAVVFFLMVK